MTSSTRLRQWTAVLALTVGMTVALWGCAAVPGRYISIAEPGVTLTALTTHPQSYVGKVVLLGGTITGEEENEQHLLLRLKNRPLDQDYRPHRPVDTDSPEGGSYWVIVPKQQLPLKYRNWARATVVGRVTGMQRSHTEPVLMLLYIRGWGASDEHGGIWETIDPNYVLTVPSDINPKN